MNIELNPEWREVKETRAEEEINNLIDQWHLGVAGQDLALHEWLGWTREEYALWVEVGTIPTQEGKS